MIEALILLSELVLVAALLWYVRKAPMRPKGGDLGWFKYHESLTSADGNDKEQTKGGGNA